MDLILGQTYKSPRHGRLIRVVEIQEMPEECILTIYWIDFDTEDEEFGTLLVSKSDLRDWKVVKRV